MPLLSNYLKIAFRSLVRNRLYSAINVVGLSVSMACCLLITLYVWHETHYDRFHKNAELIYRVITRVKMAGSDDGLALSTADIGPQLRQTYPEIAETVRFNSLPVATVKNGNELINEGDMYEVDPSVFAVFSFQLLSGSETALDKPNSVVLTQRMAKKYFGDRDAMGQMLQINKQPYTITGVLQDLPTNTDLKFSALLTWHDVPATAEDVVDPSCYTFLLFQNPAQAAGFSKKLAYFDQTQVTPRVKALGYDIKIEHQIQALTSLHFVDGLYDDTPKGDRMYLLIFAIVGTFILLVACINYVNIYVAQSINRLKEVSIRKVVGAGKGQLIGQFLGEAFLIVVISAGLSLAIMSGLRPVFERLTATPLTFPGWPLVWAAVSVVGLIGLLAGLYPALFLSASHAPTVLKGGRSFRQTGRAGNQYGRKGLVVLQFTISIALIISTLIVGQQTNYLLDKNPGFTREQVLVVSVPADESVRQKMRVLRTNLAKDSRIKAVSLGLSPITFDGKTSILKETPTEKTELFAFFARIDENYLRLLNIKLLSGRNFDPAIPSDQSRGVIVNERFVKWMGWQVNKAVGQVINPPKGDTLVRQVIGVVADYHFASLHNQVEPLMLHYKTDNPPNVLVRIKPGDVGLVRSAWTRLIPDHPFESAFLDTAFNGQYQLEGQTKQVMSWFSMLIIFIACLGLFGLATFTAEQRTKEIGVRKVLGASVVSIVALLSKDFLKLVLIAIIIASPIAWWAMNRWLQDFAYRIDMAWWVFALAGMLAVAIALLTVSFQAIKAALVNPVKSLRSE